MVSEEDYNRFEVGDGIVVTYWLEGMQIIGVRSVAEFTANPWCPTCGYNLTGTIGTDKFTCPECGHIISNSPAESD